MSFGGNAHPETALVPGSTPAAKPAPAPPPSGYRADIDGLRAIAVTVVVLYHAGVPAFSGGFIGVDVFFVISGFLITNILWVSMDRAEGEGVRALRRFEWKRFYARRFRRLLPMALLTTVVTLIAGGMWLLADPDVRWLGQSVAATSAFLGNVFFMLKTSDYFGADAHSIPLLHFWSLAVEEQFYVVWPVVLLVAHGLRSGLRRRNPRLGSALMWTVLLGLTLVSLAAAQAVVASHQSWAFYLMPFRLWEMAAGGALAIAGTRFSRWHPVVRDALAVVGLALIVGSVVRLDEMTRFPGATAIPAVAGTLMVLVAGQGGANRGAVNRRVLAWSPFVRLGKLSYSWYLLHWPPLVIVQRVTLERHVGRDVAIVLLMLVASMLAFRFVEEPVRRGRWRPMKSDGAALATGTAMLVVVAIAGLGLSRYPESISVLDVSPSAAAAIRDNRQFMERCPQQPRGGAQQVDCSVGNPDDSRPVLLIGDSFAASLLPGVVETVGPDRRVDVLWSAGCPLTIFDDAAASGRWGSDCLAESEQRVAYVLENAATVSGVVVAGYASAAVGSGGSQLWQESVSAALAPIVEAGVPVVYLLEWPVYPWNVPECVVRGRRDCDMARVDAEAGRQVATEASRAALSDLEGVMAIDPFESLCDAAVCRSNEEGVVRMSDENHLSTAGATLLADQLRTALDAVGAG